ncbi:MAG: antibiotic biosynthesis monooxygenase [Deltaproteobacteria bacterium]|nr:antibiotic biosynthesis monooxygenase [Deltaproteobacteria bacterium]
MTHVIVWEFRVREGFERAFEEAYGPRGGWAALFARSPQCLGTALLKDESSPGRYLTLDRWTTAEAFAEFKATHGAAYDDLDAHCAAWTDTEVRIGAWKEL